MASMTLRSQKGCKSEVGGVNDQKNIKCKKLQGWQGKGRRGVTRAQEPGPLSRNRGCLSGGRVGTGPREETRPQPTAKKGGEKSSDFSLPPASSCHHSLPLAEPNRKPVSKGTWET